jgi:hypothetical protein
MTVLAVAERISIQSHMTKSVLRQARRTSLIVRAMLTLT